MVSLSQQARIFLRRKLAQEPRRTSGMPLPQGHGAKMPALKARRSFKKF